MQESGTLRQEQGETPGTKVTVWEDLEGLRFRWVGNQNPADPDPDPDPDRCAEIFLQTDHLHIRRVYSPVKFDGNGDPYFDATDDDGAFANFVPLEPAQEA